MNEEVKAPPAIIKRERVVLAGVEPKAPLRSSASTGACRKKDVRLVEHEGRVRAIEFTCSCGEASLVELVFEAEPATGKSGVKS
jgi:hypothetical protein